MIEEYKNNQCDWIKLGCTLLRATEVSRDKRRVG